MIDAVEIAANLKEKTLEHIQAWRDYQNDKPLEDRVYPQGRWDGKQPTRLLVRHTVGFRCIGILQPVEWRQ